MHVMHLDHDSAIQKVRVAEDAWNTRDPRIFRQWAHKKGRNPGFRPSVWCAEHVRQLRGESPLLNLMEVKG